MTFSFNQSELNRHPQTEKCNGILCVLYTEFNGLNHQLYRFCEFDNFFLYYSFQLNVDLMEIKDDLIENHTP